MGHGAWGIGHRAGRAGEMKNERMKNERMKELRNRWMEIDIGR
jgi:hypothetical protein